MRRVISSLMSFVRATSSAHESITRGSHATRRYMEMSRPKGGTRYKPGTVLLEFMCR